MKIDRFDGSKEGNAKFLVVDGKVYMSELVNIIRTTHPDLGRQDGVHDEIIRLRKVDPSKVCGGVLVFFDNTLRITLDSSGYKLPVIGCNAEQQTMEAFRQIISPTILLYLSNVAAYPQNAPLMLD